MKTTERKHMNQPSNKIEAILADVRNLERRNAELASALASTLVKLDGANAYIKDMDHERWLANEQIASLQKQLSECEWFEKEGKVT